MKVISPQAWSIKGSQKVVVQPVRDRGGGCTGSYNAILSEGRAFYQLQLSHSSNYKEKNWSNPVYKGRGRVAYIRYIRRSAFHRPDYGTHVDLSLSLSHFTD